MKRMVKISMFILIFTIGLTGCTEDDVKEAHYMGVWTIHQYENNGWNNTYDYLAVHKNYSMHIKPLYQFTETWVEYDQPQSTSGTWNMSENGKSVLLQDNRFGERKYELNYMYTLKLRSGDEEWILRKL